MAKRRKPAGASVRRPGARPVPFFPPSFVMVQALYQREFEQKSARALQNLELRDRIEELRRYVKGFEGSRFNLRKIDDWSQSDRETVIESSKRLRYLIARPHVSVPIPRSRDKRRALTQFTQQNARELKRFIVHTEVPEKTRVEFAGRGKQTRLQLKIRSGKTWKTSYTRQFFLWSDFNKGRHPATLGAQRRVLERMLPHMPRGKYAFWTDRHGMIGTPIDRDFLRQRLTEWYHAYEVGPERDAHRGFGRVLTGLVYLGTWRSARLARRRVNKERTRYQNRIRLNIKARRKVSRKVKRDIFNQILKRVTTPKRKKRKKPRKHK